MKTGIRFTCLKSADPILDESWEYKGLSYVDAVEKKLEDMFYYADKIKATDIIDTLQILLNADSEYYIDYSDELGEDWPIDRRMQLYQEYINKYDLNLILELEFPTIITDNNIEKYAQYALEIITKYSWVKYWQIMTLPETIDDDGNIKCSGLNYAKLMKLIYTGVHAIIPDINIGGPGILSAISEYNNSEYKNIDGNTAHTGWLAEATGEYYGIDDAYTDGGPTGFLSYIDFFAFQGRQDYVELRYTVYQSVITKLKNSLVQQAAKSNLTLDIPWFSTYQGHAGHSSLANKQDYLLQAYRDLREFVNTFAVNVRPFKTQLVDEFFNQNKKSDIEQANYYGILTYDLKQKESYKQYQFVIETLEPFTKLPVKTLSITRKKPFEDNDNIDFLMLMDDAETKLATIIFPKNERDVISHNPSYETISLKASGDRTYYLSDGTKKNLLNPLDISFKDIDFCIVIENLVVEITTDEEIKEQLERRLKLYQQVAADYMRMIPSTYNHEVFDTNFYKLLRSVAIETGDAKFFTSILEDNMYLDTVHADAIYNNFGAMIGVPWQKRWTEKDYRRIVSGFFESLLTGATKKSITKAIQMFTQLDVEVYELFTDYEHYGIAKDNNWDNQYRFTVELQRDVDDSMSLDTIYDDVKFVTDIVKPAHTVPIIMIVLVSQENYKDWYKERYNKDFSESDQGTEHFTALLTGNEYGWKLQDYNFVFRTSPTTKIEPYLLNGPFLLGPRYTLYDIERDSSIHNFNEYYFLDKTYFKTWGPELDEFYLSKTNESYFALTKFESIRPLDELLALVDTYYEEQNFFHPVDEAIEMTLTYIFTEPKYGWGRTLVNDQVIKINGGIITLNPLQTEERKTISHHWPCVYWLENWHNEDILWQEEENYDPKSDDLLLELDVDEHEEYEVKEENDLFWVTDFQKELKFGWRFNVNHDKDVFMTNGYRGMKTLESKWAVTYTVYDNFVGTFVEDINTEKYNVKNTESSSDMIVVHEEQPYKPKRDKYNADISITYEDSYDKTLLNDEKIHETVEIQYSETKPYNLISEYEEKTVFKTWGPGKNVVCGITNINQTGFYKHIADVAFMKMYTVDKDNNETIIQYSRGI